MQDRHGDFSDLVGMSTISQLIVDRNCGGTVHHQWVQDRGSVVITGVYIHALNNHKALDTGFSKWLSFDEKDLARLRTKVDSVPKKR